MSSDLAIRVEGLSKAYTVRHKRHDHVTLAQSALERVKHPFQRDEREEFWALRDVSFEVKQGEVLGIIGRNGAGKSTLLKLLTRITGPTAGRIDLWGRVGSLLEVGTGFHPELTGRENVYLNGSILGMRRKEIEQQFDAIVDFAGVEKFLDTPVKRYSSGMYVRLAFAVAAHLDTEILLLDEVLAVGDIDFQKRCMRKIHDVADDGRTVLLVSHQTANVRSISNECLLLAGGSVIEHGPTGSVLERYAELHGGNSTSSTDAPRPEPHLGTDVRIKSVRIAGVADAALIPWDERVRVVVGMHSRSSHRAASIVLTIKSDDGSPVGAIQGPEMDLAADSDCTLELLLPPMRLRPGSYSADLSIGFGGWTQGRQGLDKIVDGLRFFVSGSGRAGPDPTRWWRGFGYVDLGAASVSAEGGHG